MSGVMLYNKSTIDNLVSELQSYYTKLTTEMQNAQDAANKLVGQAWSSDQSSSSDAKTDGASGAFYQKHTQLIADMQTLCDTLKTGIQNVQQAEANASITDGKVASTFSW